MPASSRRAFLGCVLAATVSHKAHVRRLAPR
jgi:hypothetical protein